MAHTIIQEYQKKYKKKTIPRLQPGMTVRVKHKFTFGGKEREQMFQGVIIKMHDKTSVGATFTVRKLVDGIGVEKVFPVHSPNVEVEIVKAGKAKRAKLYFLRDRTGKATRLKDKKQKEFAELTVITEEDERAMQSSAVAEEPVAEEVVETSTAADKPVEETSTEAPATEEVKTEEPKEEKKESAQAESDAVEEKKEEASEEKKEETSEEVKEEAKEEVKEEAAPEVAEEKAEESKEEEKKAE